MKKLFTGILLFVFTLSACGGNPTAPAPRNPTAAPAPITETAVPTRAQSGAPTVIETGATVSPATDAAPDALSPTAAASSPSGCTNSAAFVADVTVPDNQLFQPGEKFDKTWRVKNTGTCAWSNQYMLAFSNGARMNAPESVPLQETAPGQTLDITIPLTAPSEETITHARADFEVRDEAGAAMPVDGGSTLWVIIKIANTDAPKSNPAPSGGPGYANVTCSYTTNPAKINEVIAALTAYRAKNGLPPYTINAQLTEAAQAHSADMACNQLFYHYGSNNSTAKSRVAASGYAASAVTENVYGSYPPLSGPDVIVWWANDLADPRHNENLLSARYVDIGIGYAFYNNFGYFVIDFAVP